MPAVLSHDGRLKEMQGKKVYPKIIVDDVKFDGPFHVPNPSDEPEIISDLKQHVFDHGQEGLDEISEVEIERAWQDQGFFKVVATGQMKVLSADSNFEHVVITIHVEPGLQYRLGNVRFRNAEPDQALAFPQDRLRKLIPLEEGDLFIADKIRLSLDAFKKMYGKYGYIEFVATPITDVDDQARRISLIMEFSEGKQFRVRKLEVFGLNPSKAAMLTSAVKPGDIFQYGIVEKFVRANIPAFFTVISSEVLVPRKNEEEGTVDIVADFRRLPKK